MTAPLDSITGEMDAWLESWEAERSETHVAIANCREALSTAEARLVELEDHDGRVRAARALLIEGEPAKVVGADRPAAPPAGTAPPTGQHQCPCGFVAKNGTGLSAHMRHCSTAQTAAGAEPEPKKPRRLKRDEISCPDCGQEFAYRSELAKHRREAGHWGES